MDPYTMVITVANQKGGCAKTTTAVNLAAALAKGEKDRKRWIIPPSKVLLIDLDPQGNCSTSFGVEKRQLKKTVHDLLMNESGEDLPIMDEFLLSPEQLTESMQRTWKTEYPNKNLPKGLVVENLWLLPSSIHLSGAEIELSHRLGRETRLREALSSIEHEFDYIIIDTPPSLGLLTINAMAVSRWVLIPVQAEFYALEGMSLLMNSVKLVQRRINPHLKLMGIVMTMVMPKSKLSNTVCNEVKEHFPKHVYSTVIQRLVKIAEAPSEGAPTVLLHKRSNDSKGRGSLQYWTFAKEFHQRVEGKRKNLGFKKTNRLNA
ncbi:MAG: AAA family ATPase [Candidatus Poseidoniaceae archaeon]|nr:AAA family ATPase [Candidatus Poseidoniaceae archaeon]MDP7202620.1 AAA family ATPase [Candidatus Poseidoniaceae archaeon]